MRKKIILLTLVLMFNFINVFADIRPPYPPSPPPIKEEKQQGFCFAPVIIAGMLLSLSIFTFGLHLTRYYQTQLQVNKTVR